MLTAAVGLQKAMESAAIETVKCALATIPPGVLAQGCDVISKAAGASLQPGTLWQIRGPSVQEIYRWLRSILFSSLLGSDMRCIFIQNSEEDAKFPHEIAHCHWLDSGSVIIYMKKVSGGQKAGDGFEYMDYVSGLYADQEVLIKRFQNCDPEVIDHEAYIRGVLNGLEVTQTLVGVLPGSDVTFGAAALVLRSPPNTVPLGTYLSSKTPFVEAIAICQSAARALYLVHQHDIVLNDLHLSHLAVSKDPAAHPPVNAAPKVLLMDLSAATVARGRHFHKAAQNAAPEVVCGKAASRASDIYSLGQVLSTVATRCGVRQLEYAVKWCGQADPEARPSAQCLMGYLETLGDLVTRLERHTRGEVLTQEAEHPVCRPVRSIVMRYLAECTQSRKVVNRITL